MNNNTGKNSELVKSKVNDILLDESLVKDIIGECRVVEIDHLGNILSAVGSALAESFINIDNLSILSKELIKMIRFYYEEFSKSGELMVTTIEKICKDIDANRVNSIDDILSYFSYKLYDIKFSVENKVGDFEKAELVKLANFSRFLSLRGINISDGARYVKEFDKAEDLVKAVATSTDSIRIMELVDQLRESTDVIGDVIYTLKLDYSSLTIHSARYLVKSILEHLLIFDNRLTAIGIVSYGQVLSEVYQKLENVEYINLGPYVEAVRDMVSLIKERYESKIPELKYDGVDNFHLLSDSMDNGLRPSPVNPSDTLIIEFMRSDLGAKELVIDFIFERMPDSMKSEDKEDSVVQYIQSLLK